MSTFTKASDETIELIYRVMEKYHGGHRDAEVTVQALMAHPPRDEDGYATGPALKLHGHKCAATIRATKAEERVLGACDLEIKLDSDHWEESSEEERIALLDHELMHFPLKLNSKGELMRDDQERPRFQKREHDRQYGFFDLAAQRHGIASAEVIQTQAFIRCETYTQCYLPGMDERPADAIEKPRNRKTIEGESGDVMDKANVRTKDGRTITLNQMLDEVKSSFAVEAAPIPRPRGASKRK